MLTEFARNTRKQNLAVLAAKQEEAVGSDNDTLRNFVGGAFLGRMDDEQAAARALRPGADPHRRRLRDRRCWTCPAPPTTARTCRGSSCSTPAAAPASRRLIEIARAGDHLDWLWPRWNPPPGRQFTGTPA